jgi:Ni,Fe-hydrogenase maturation factor
MQFPDIEFIELDPNENWDIPDPFLIIDTVQGIPDIRIFRGLKEFDAAPAVSVHDFDALFNLRYLEKLGKLKRVVIVGVPPGVNENAALTDVSEALRRVIETND